MARMYDLEVWHNGRHTIDLSCGSKRRVRERFAELDRKRDVAARVIRPDGRVSHDPDCRFLR
jgi:hypothetical protein